MKKTANRSNGQGTLWRKARDGKHYGAWIARFMVDGKTIQKSTGTENRAEAEKRLQVIAAELGITARNAAETLRHVQDHLAGEEARIERARQEAQDAAPALRIADAWEEYANGLNHRDWDKSTVTHYEGRAAAFAAWMGKRYPKTKELRAVTSEQAEEFMREIRDTRSAKTFNDYRALLSMLWEGLAKNPKARIERNPWKEIRPLAKDTHTRRALTVEELRRVCGAVQGEMRLLFAVGIYTGLRLGDAVTLEWGAVDLVRGFIVTKPHKTEKHGTIAQIPLVPYLAAMLEETPPEERTGAIMPTLAERYGMSGGAKYISNKIQAAFKACGIETNAGSGRMNASGTERQAVEVGFHSLRHTYVSLLGNSGVPLAVAKKIVGHINEDMTEHYFHANDEALRAAAAALPAIGTDAETPAAIEDAAGDIMRDFQAIIERMDADTRRAALAKLRALVGE